VDFFLLLMLAGAGDELQGMKKGIMEMADAIAITKADGDNARRAGLAQAEYQNALHLFPPSGNGWEARVLTCSALDNQGIAPLWQLIEAHCRLMQQNGFFARNRQEQQLRWMHETVQQTLQEHFYNHPSVKSVLDQVEADVKAGKIPATQAALQLLKRYEK